MAVPVKGTGYYVNDWDDCVQAWVLRKMRPNWDHWSVENGLEGGAIWSLRWLWHANSPNPESRAEYQAWGGDFGRFFQALGGAAGMAANPPDCNLTGPPLAYATGPLDQPHWKYGAEDSGPDSLRTTWRPGMPHTAPPAPAPGPAPSAPAPGTAPAGFDVGRWIQQNPILVAGAGLALAVVLMGARR